MAKAGPLALESGGGRAAESAAAPEISVVIPCLNAAETLGEQLEALEAQRWQGGWEVLVADNGSTDGSREVVASFQERLPGLRCVDAGSGSGPGHARNVGVEAARGHWVLFCDADDRVEPGWVEALGQALQTVDFVASRYRIDALNPEWIQASRENPQGEGLNPYVYPPFLDHAGGGGLGIRRSLHLEHGGFDPQMRALEDTDYCWRLQLAGVELHFVPEAVVQIRFRPSLAGVFRQARQYGRYNVLIYKEYQDRGMPRLPGLRGFLKWGSLLLAAPQLLSRAGRARWLSQLGWRVGRLEGSLAYRVLAL